MPTVTSSCRTFATAKERGKLTGSSSRPTRNDKPSTTTYNKKRPSSSSPPPSSRVSRNNDSDGKYYKKQASSASASSSSSRQNKYRDDSRPSRYNDKERVSSRSSSPRQSRYDDYDDIPKMYQSKNKYKDDAKPSRYNSKERSSVRSSSPRPNRYDDYDDIPKMYQTKNKYKDDDKPSRYNNKERTSSPRPSRYDDDDDILKMYQSKKKKAAPQVKASAGRIAILQQQDRTKKRHSKMPKLCVGCGTEVIAVSGSSGGGGGGGKVRGMVAGQDTEAGKKARYVDAFSDPSLTFESGRVNGFLCERCKALQSNNIWKAYDSLRDVSPKVFADQLQHIVKRRRFGLCVMVVDATDAEHSSIKNLRKIIGSAPVFLALNKIDLMPRFNNMDRRLLAEKVQGITGLRVKHQGYAVSAVTGVGIVDLATDILKIQGGRDVFVVGCANVGKSSLVKKLSELIAMSVWYRDPRGKERDRRRLAAANLNVTGSNLPGTTLQAVRIPCFSSKEYALWDTPGIINARAIQYHLFPSHLMEPMLHPGKIEIPTTENGLAGHIAAGFSMLIEATWMDGDDNDDEEDGTSKGGSSEGTEEAYGVLARIDVKEIETQRPGQRLFAQAFIHPALRVRVVPTELAPSNATVAPHHIEVIKKRIRKATKTDETGLADSYSLPLCPYISPDRPDGVMKADIAERCPNGFYRLDIVFPSLGFVNFTNTAPYSLIPHCVQGSVFSKRSRSLYPIKLANYLEEHGKPEFETEEITEEVMKGIRDAAKTGRHDANNRKPSEEGYSDDYHPSYMGAEDPEFFYSNL